MCQRVHRVVSYRPGRGAALPTAALVLLLAGACTRTQVTAIGVTQDPPPLPPVDRPGDAGSHAVRRDSIQFMDVGAPPDTLEVDLVLESPR